MPATVETALLIFFLRTIDITLATMRMLIVVRGMKLLAWVIGFFQALVFVLAIREILTDTNNVLNILGFAAGFATGNVVGMFIEDRLAIGHTHLRIISPRHGQEIAERVREQGYAVTEMSGRGKDGMVTVLSASVLRKHRRQIESFISEIDPDAFITAENVTPVRRGFWG